MTISGSKRWLAWAEISEFPVIVIVWSPLYKLSLVCICDELITSESTTISFFTSGISLSITGTSLYHKVCGISLFTVNLTVADASIPVLPVLITSKPVAQYFLYL